MTRQSSNGWGVIESVTSKSLRPWTIGPITLIGRVGPAGFLLAHQALWFHEEIEPLWPADMPDYDDHWYGQRYIGGTDTPSNHWSATAIDLNAKRHPQHVPVLETFTAAEARRIRTRLRDKYDGAIEWGGDWSPARVDAMHFELRDKAQFTSQEITRIALEQVQTAVGRRLLRAQDQPVLWEKWAA